MTVSSHGIRARASVENIHARHLFDPIAQEYDLLLEVLSLFQNSRWRRFLISRLRPSSNHTVLDLCTGTAGVAVEIAKKHGCRVVGVDLSDGMLREGAERVKGAEVTHLVDLIRGRAESLSYRDGQFDAVAFTYLLRYVDDPLTTLSEIVRVLKPGGTIASLDFSVPRGALVRGLWRIYTGWALSLATRYVSDGWRCVGQFLGPNISQFYQRYSVEDILAMWREVGIVDAQARMMTFGGAVVMWGTKGT
ncbi:MAG: class I SAM-dependent methyltransferase [Dehalococcoidia bacterium]